MLEIRIELRFLLPGIEDAMGIQCRSCHLEFPFDKDRAGEVIECPYCDRYNTMPMTDPDGSPEPAAEGAAANGHAGGAANGVARVVPLNGTSLASTFRLPCPACQHELKLFFFDSLDPLCPHCKASLCNVELPTPKQIAEAAESTAAAEAIGAIFERLAAQKQQQAAALPRVVAEWMVSEFDRRDRRLPLRQTITQIRKNFGNEFIYHNEFNQPAIAQIVLDEFRKLTTNCVVWDRGGEFWRERKPGEVFAPKFVAKPGKRVARRKKS